MSLLLFLWVLVSSASEPDPIGFWVTDHATLKSKKGVAIEPAPFWAAFREPAKSLPACLPDGETGVSLTLDLTFGKDGEATNVAHSPSEEVKACAAAAMEGLVVSGIPEGSVAHLPGVLWYRPEAAESVVLGSLDKNLIDAVINRHRKAIRHCYQVQLTEQPTLAGKLAIKFVIGADGAVESANIKPQSTTLPSGHAQECIVDTFLKMRFPKPEGGGIVIVSYPFVFSPG